MTDYTARNVLLKDSSGNYLIPYTEKADLSLGNLNSAGKAYVAIKGYDSTATYSLNEVVMTVVSGSVLFYRSLVDNNTASLSDTTKWSEVSFGSGANVDLSNLSNTGEAHFANPALTNSPYITNRILEIPQDIKLDLNNGTLTLKEGSKVYIPNGSGIFDSFTLLSDAGSGDISGISTDYMFFVNSVGGLSGTRKANCYSGTVEPTGTASVFWYDTANNVVKRHNGTSWVSGYSLPFCVISSGASSIDQIFNGFGYIGSTVFALPGVKTVVPDGRNEDGTCKVIETTTTTVVTNSYSGSVEMNWYINDSDIISYYGSNYIKFSENNLWEATDGTGAIIKGTVFATSTVTSGVISNWKPCNVDSVANSNASNFTQAGRSYLSGLGMPSTKYDNITILASGQSYTAPANGYFVYDTAVGGASYVLMSNSTAKIYTADIGGISGIGKITMRCFVPCYKGNKMSLTYSLTSGSSTTLYFVYAEGEN